MITIIDYKMGNLRSIANRLERLDVPVVITSEINLIAQADKIILPGVGAFAQGMKNLQELNLIEILDKKVLTEKIPVLGICLGMQLFAQSGTEGVDSGSARGLGWIKAKAERFNFSSATQQRVPHVGWNTIEKLKPSSVLEGIDEDNRFYFTHSYHLVYGNLGDVAAQTTYGYSFPSVIQKDNIFGVQFHPETSHKDGIQILKNFVELGVNAAR